MSKSILLFLLSFFFTLSTSSQQIRNYLDFVGKDFSYVDKQLKKDSFKIRSDNALSDYSYYNGYFWEFSHNALSLYTDRNSNEVEHVTITNYVDGNYWNILYEEFVRRTSEYFGTPIKKVSDAFVIDGYWWVVDNRTVHIWKNVFMGSYPPTFSIGIEFEKGISLYIRDQIK